MKMEMLKTRSKFEGSDKVNRVELIDKDGRSYVRYLEGNEQVRYSLQDDNRTLKIFIDDLVEVPCKTHPDAPHGFDRNASHSLDRYVCECEYLEPDIDYYGINQ